MDSVKFAAPLAAGVGATAGVIQQLLPSLVPLEDAIIVGLLALIPLIVSLAQAEIRARIASLEQHPVKGETGPVGPAGPAGVAIVPVAPVVMHADPTPAQEPTPVARVTNPQASPLSTDDLIAELLNRLKPNVEVVTK